MLVTTLMIAASFAMSGQCTSAERAAGLCNVENSGTSVDIDGTLPGSGGGGGGGSRWPDDRANGGSDDGSGADEDECLSPHFGECGYSYTVVTLEPTLSDVASFAPDPLALIDEPDGVGIVGMPVNFVVDAAPHEQTGELFDLPVTVRFEPVSVLFVHGDGTSREAADGGRSWAELGLAQFSATSTSHAYADRGTYTASAVVRYAAGVDFGNGWVEVPGLLEIPTSAMSIRILEVRTALVDRTCAEDPTGPGC